MSIHKILKNIFLEFGSPQTQGISTECLSYFVKQLDLGQGRRAFIGYTASRKG